MDRNTTPAAILLLALTTASNALDRSLLLHPRGDEHTSNRLYLASMSVGTWSSPDAEERYGVDFVVSPFLFQFLSGWSEGRAGFSTSLGFAYHNPDRYGMQGELGIHIAQSFTFCGTLLRVPDKGWEPGLRLAYNIGWSGPAKSTPQPPPPDKP